MRRTAKVILAILLILFAIAGGVYWVLYDSFDSTNLDAIENNYKLEFNEINESIYIQARVWGLTGDHMEIIVSSSPIKRGGKDDNVENYLFYGPEIYFRKQGVDTLFVFAESASIGTKPTSFNSQIEVVVKELDSFDESQDYSKNYLKLGLSRASVYD